jgi:hypothetical protein
MDSPSPPPVYTPPAPTPPDPYATAQAQEGFAVNSAIAQNQLNNANQVTPYGDISYQQTGGSMVGGSPAVADTPATGGYWNGQMWVPTGGVKGHPADPGHFVPTYTATTTLTPELQAILNSNERGAMASSLKENSLLSQIQNQGPLDLSWGALQNNIFGLEKNSLDPYWAQQQNVTDQNLANQGLTPGSEGWKYAQTQFGTNKGNAYNNAMLQAQNQAASDITQEYNAPINWYNALRTGSQVVQAPGVGGAPTAAASISPQSGAYSQTANQNYATGSQALTSAEQIQQQQYQSQLQQSNMLMGGLFGLGGDLIKGLGGLI